MKKTGIFILVLMFFYFMFSMECFAYANVYENYSMSNLESSDNSFEAVIKCSYDSLGYSEQTNSFDRNLNKKHYEENNALICRNLDLDNYDYYVSKYAPFIFVRYESYKEYQNSKKFLKKIAKHDSIDNITIEVNSKKTKIEANVNGSVSDQPINMSQVKSMVGIQDSNFLGDGIKVGIIDFGTPYYTYSISDNIVEDRCYYTDSYTGGNYHTSKVLSVLCGSEGIAPNVSIYITSNDYNKINGQQTTATLGDNIEWLLNKNVDIINFSGSNSTAADGLYTGYCAYIDYIVATRNILFVKSAGNNGDTKLISSPGGALNVLTVGSVDANQNVASTSSYLMAERYNNKIIKPNLVAPGEKINTYMPSLFSFYGTSFAAPIVTGIAARLLQEFSFLKDEPFSLINYLMLGANKLPSQSSMLDITCGAGLVNYSNTKFAISTGYKENYICSADYVGDVVGQEYFYAEKTDYELAFYSITPYSVAEPDGYNELEYSNNAFDINCTRYDIEIWDYTEENCFYSYSTYTNFIIDNIELEIGARYSIVITMYSNRPSDNYDKCHYILV